MARTKQSKPKEMFKTYNPDTVPDIMPFPELSHVAATKGDETAVPKLNEYQQSWILDVGVQNVDLASLKGKAANDLYDRVKNDAFEAKAFKHTPQPQDRDEEARLSALVTAWKRNKKKLPAAANDGDTSDEEEDEGGHAAVLRGYPKAGWRLAIQKVISNKRTAERTKRKTPKDDAGESNPEAANVAALEKLFGLTVYTGRDKFLEDRHDEINKYSKTLSGNMNAGGKFRKAEAELWAKEDQASWEAAAAGNEDVDWLERQKLVPSGFKHMVNTLHNSGKFRPFVATMLMAWVGDDGRVAEAVPKDIHVRQPFDKLYEDLVNDTVNSMYTWAEKPLKDYLATREVSAKGPPPAFPLGVDAVDDVTPKVLAQMVTSFLVQSYEAVFGSQEIPWAAIASEPSEYYEAAKFQLSFAPTGLADLTRSQCRGPRDCGILPQGASSTTCSHPDPASSATGSYSDPAPSATGSYSDPAPFTTCSDSDAVSSATSVHSDPASSAAGLYSDPASSTVGSHSDPASSATGSHSNSAASSQIWQTEEIYHEGYCAAVWRVKEDGF
ncbi:Acid protease [Mycena venus]|uniref:Acid protease n=1 Tax=Mycena venus TaxID=2733690 RepID=A0A8H6WTV8_9AGAR|nr:Acid protease [Mycena venus]